MPTLNWIGEEAVAKNHSTVPFRLLEPAPELSLPSPAGIGAGGEGADSGNLIVQGENLHALKAGPASYRLFESLPMMPRFTVERVRQKLETSFQTANAAVKVPDDWVS